MQHGSQVLRERASQVYRGRGAEGAVCCRQCLLNVVADSTSGVLGFVILAKDSEGRGQLFRTIGRIFGGFSDTAKAFVIIASTDILLGYGTESCDSSGKTTTS